MEKSEYHWDPTTIFIVGGKEGGGGKSSLSISLASYKGGCCSQKEGKGSAKVVAVS